MGLSSTSLSRLWFVAASGSSTLQTSSYVLHPPASALPGAKGSQHGQQTVQGEVLPGKRFAFCWEDVHGPRCSAQSQSISSPQKRKAEWEVPADTHLPHHQPLQKVAAEPEGPDRKYRRQVCGVSESWGGLCVRVPLRMCPPQGQQSLPGGSFGASCAVLALSSRHSHPQYTHRSGNFISYTGMEWFWGWP